MYLKYVGCVGIVLMFSGCNVLPGLMLQQQMTDAEVTKENVSFNTSNQARLRIYYDSANIVSHPDKSCTAWKQSKFKNYFKAVGSSLPNHEIIQIGMPVTEGSLAVFKPKTGWGVKPTYKEFVVSANQPFVLDARYVDAVVKNESCQIAGEFIPKAGEQYEARYKQTANSCSLTINRINTAQKAQVYAVESPNLIKRC